MKKSKENRVDAVELLESQHREVEDLFKQYESADRHARKEKIFERIADNLAAHASIEEQLFYPAAYGLATRDLLREAVEEHLGVKRIIADLLAMSPSHENYDAKVKVLKELVEHHVEEEEGELFPKANEELTAEERESLGAEMENLFDTLMESEPRFEVPSETEEAASIH